MTFRVPTRALIALLTDLICTAPDTGATIGSILLHTGRGALGAEPGLTDLLCGASTDRMIIGHTYPSATPNR